MGCARVMTTFSCPMARRGNAPLVRQRLFNLEQTRSAPAFLPFSV
jgi:hypothetical protein